MNLATQLRDELQAVAQLHRLLDVEYNALKSRDLTGLERAVADKHACLDYLRGLIAQRLDELRALGISADAQGLAAYLETLPVAERGEAVEVWAALTRATEQVHQQNEVNGAVIAASRSHIERTMAILRGRDSLDFLYDQDTRQVFGGSSQPIAKA